PIRSPHRPRVRLDVHLRNAPTLLALAALLGCAGCAPRPKLHRVEIRAFRFEPSTLTVAPGDTVEWANLDIVPHTATSTGSPAFDSGSISIKGSWRWVPGAAGTHDYRCTFHPTMLGK